MRLRAQTKPDANLRVATKKITYKFIGKNGKLKITTSSLRDHLSNKHGIVEECQVAKKARYSDLSKYFVEMSDINLLLAKLVINMRLPLSIVENEDFRNLIALIPRSKVFSTKSFIQFLKELYVEVAASTKDFFAGHSVALTTDTWTSNGSVNFFSLTVHFINESWELEKRYLSCTRFTGKHSADNIAKQFLEEQRKYFSDDQVVVRYYLHL
jgi:hypothetical protein